MTTATQIAKTKSRLSGHRRLSSRQARHVALAAQGFGKVARSAEPDPKAISGNTTWRVQKRHLTQMLCLQIDAINTVIRSHYMPLYSRIGPYSRDTLDLHLFDPKQQTLARREFYEYWGHECSLMPLSFYPLLYWRMQDAQNDTGMYRQCLQIARRRPALIRKIRSALQSNGPLSSRELESSKRGPGMWEWSETKQALEYLFWTGEATTRGRKGFERLYDLTENTIPSCILEKCNLERIDAQASLLEHSARALGVATAADIRDYFRLSAADANPAMERLLEQKRLQLITVEGWSKPAFWVPGTRVPRSLDHSALLTPFDPIVWNRKRASQLFGFEYRIEIYVPAAKRKYGYYVLPFLHNGELVARLDIKADRVKSCLRVLGCWWESQAAQEAGDALHTELQRLQHWLGLESLSWPRSRSRGLRQPQ